MQGVFRSGFNVYKIVIGVIPVSSDAFNISSRVPGADQPRPVVKLVIRPSNRLAVAGGKLQHRAIRLYILPFIEFIRFTALGIVAGGGD